ncbi:hypothetical protein N7452_011336 [Penicillium brevicompactum]|uniref:Uncharacterized protein n=1 Tax=Penicillium brevicompactum TaxID=5074 RepID=A0A9W9Q535_PENBR|nr:hypothetical protein N7452_011336 [Penicillium brevicompactum]
MSSGREVEPSVLAAERTLAAYLGFDDIVQMQRFLITWPCLEALRLSQRLVPNTGEAVFPPFVPSDFEPHNNHNESVLISVLRAMARDIRIFINSSDEYNRDRTSRAIARMPSRMWLPELAQEETPSS